MHEGIDVNALNRHANAQRRSRIDIEQLAGRLHEQGPEPLAAANGRMAHGLLKPPPGIVGRGEEMNELRVNIARNKIGRASCGERVCQYVCISVVEVVVKKNKVRMT